jgi:uncharacterized protein YndB with AHSA1/START domain
MAKGTLSTENAADREIVLSRVFDAPRELVWEVWTDPNHVAKWWGPNGFTTTIHDMDVRPGGKWHHTMHGPDGKDYPNKCIFKEVIKLERIIFSHGGGEKGGPGANFEATWTFDAEGDKTKVTIRMVFPTQADRDQVVKHYNAIEGGKQTLGRLADYLPQAPVILERTFKAPIHIVWKAITDIDQMKQWFIKEMGSFKPEVGFETRATVQCEGKPSKVLILTVTEVAAGKRIAYSWQLEGKPGKSHVTIELFSDEGKTRLMLTHTGLESHQPEKYPDLSRTNYLQGWVSLIGESLKEFLEKSNG